MSADYPTSHPREFDKLEKKAASLGWGISDEEKNKIIRDQVSIATNRKATRRERTAAARCIVQMNGQNIAVAISQEVHDDDHHHKIAPVAAIDVIKMMRLATTPGPIDDDSIDDAE